jgi:hypothetical protein
MQVDMADRGTDVVYSSSLARSSYAGFVDDISVFFAVIVLLTIPSGVD